jgi:hypothetical protein
MKKKFKPGRRLGMTELSKETWGRNFNFHLKIKILKTL